MGRGFHIDLNKVDDEILGWIQEWTAEEAERLKRQFPNLGA